MASVTFNKVVKFKDQKSFNNAIKTVLPQGGKDYEKSVASARAFFGIKSSKSKDGNQES